MTRLFLLVLTLSLQSQAFAVVGVGEVVLEGIDFEGGSGLSREFLESAIALPIGKPLAREKLDVEIDGAHRRLDALAFFRSIDLRLVKGSARDHFRLRVVLGQARVRYQGASLTAMHTKIESDGETDDTRRTFAEAFVGSRALFGTGLRGEIGVFRSEDKNDYGYGDNASGTVIGRASLYEPAVAGSPWFAGLNLAYSGGETHSDSRWSDGSSYHSESTSYMKLAHLTLGRRAGLFSASATLMRGMSDWRYESKAYGKENSHGFFTYWFGNARYSEKPFVGRVEPGLVASVQYMRGYAPKTEPPLITTNLARTWMIGPHALTPTGIYEHSYMTSCMNDDCHVDLRGSYDLSGTYEIVFLGTTVLGATYGEYRQRDADEFEANTYPRRRWKVALGATYSGTQIDLAFVYGDSGLDRAAFRYFFPDHSRFTQ